MRLSSHLGVTITGSRVVRWRSISNDAEPDPRMMAACSTAVGTPLAMSSSPTSTREARWSLSSPVSGCSPDR